MHYECAQNVGQGYSESKILPSSIHVFALWWHFECVQNSGNGFAEFNFFVSVGVWGGGGGGGRKER